MVLHYVVSLRDALDGVKNFMDGGGMDKGILEVGLYEPQKNP